MDGITSWIIWPPGKPAQIQLEYMFASGDADGIFSPSNAVGGKPGL